MSHHHHDQGTAGIDHQPGNRHRTGLGDPAPERFGIGTTSRAPGVVGERNDRSPTHRDAERRGQQYRFGYRFDG